MYKSVAVLVWLLLAVWPAGLLAAVSVSHLRVENLEEPQGIDTAEPRFSWRITVSPEQKNVVQTGYQLIVSDDRGEVWNTGLVSSDEQLWIPYRGKTLKSGQHLTWRVKVYTNHGESNWSNDQHFSIGLLGENRWSGRWIGLESMRSGEHGGQHSRLSARYLRKVFRLKGVPVKRATAYVAGLGLYRFFVGTTEVGADDMLKPAPTDYRRTILYQTYDVTALMADSFAVGIVLGNGKYFAPRQDKPYKNVTFGLPKCRLNIVVEYVDGTTQKLVSDDSWRVSGDGPIRGNNEYDGEEYDARMELDGWLTTDYDDSQWLKAERTALPTGTLRPQMMTSMTMTGPVIPVQHGESLYDFGENMAGWVSFMPKGRAGDTIRVRYAERLDEQGGLYVDNLRDARSEDIYVCNGHETAPWHPSFVYHGFRYVMITGAAEQVEAWHVADKMTRTGTFACSDSTLNRIVDNACRGIVSNYKGMPVDCPQRNERQPWLGDRTVGSLGESFLFDNERLYTKWMRDICESQREDGCIPDVAPAFWNYYTDDVTWPACLPFSCDMILRQYGNTKPVTDHYAAMRQWVLHMLHDNMRDDLITKDKYGDWCMPPEQLTMIHSEDPARRTDGTLIATAYMIRCLQLMEQFARLQQFSDDALYWHKRCEVMTEAFNRRFLHVAGGTSPRPGHTLYPDSTYYDNNTATANLLPLAFGIVPDTLRSEIVKQVVENIIVRNSGHVATGVIGTSWLLRTLSDNGFSDVAYLIATQRTYPSWGYMAEQGATTIWELWNGDKADAAMNSGNHVMLLGDLLSWCFQTLGGINLVPTIVPNGVKGMVPATQSEGNNMLTSMAATLPLASSTAYRHFVLKPDFTLQACSWAEVSYETPYGCVESLWRKTLQTLHWEVSVPCNTTAEVHLPDGTVRNIGSGSYTFDVPIPTRDERIVKDEFLYYTAPFASPHASTIVETSRGDLVAAYFGGTYERNPDCKIWVNIRHNGKWSAPVLAADGDGVACWNPVLTEMPGGELWLFYKKGVNVVGWTGWLVKSRDGGRTWSVPEALPEGFLGPVKNKPLLLGDKLICGSSTEGNGWRFHVEIYNLTTKEWHYVGPVESTLAPPTLQPDTLLPIDCIQPSLLQLRDGRLKVLMRTRNGFLATSYSSDNGETWTPVTLTDIPNNQSGTDAVTLRDGRHVLVYNNFQTIAGTKKGPRTPLSVAVSSDDGLTWHHVLTLEDSPIADYSYPAVVEGRDGSLHITYTWRRQRVAYKQVRL